MNMTAAAKKHWEQIPNDVRVKILNNVYCTKCNDVAGIGNVVGKMDGRDLILEGICTVCGWQVARVLEGI